MDLRRWTKAATTRVNAVGNETMLIRRSVDEDFARILAIVNDAAHAYRGVIPPDRWREPYMPSEELATEIAAGVVFWIAEQEGRLSGVMGIQDKGDVALVRHAYVATTTQRSGVGTRLLRHVEGLVDKPILIGTWAAASWAIEFYRRNGFTVVPTDHKDSLLRTYWSIPARQIETSVVLANRRWMETSPMECSSDRITSGSMELRERVLYHQIHPLKLATDTATAFGASALLWRHHLASGLTLGLLPPLAVSAILLRWANLEPYQSSRFGRYVKTFMTRRVELARLAGMLPLWLGAWWRSLLAIAAGVVWILGCWLWGLRRSASATLNM
jgi:N-acetylglutamate synthase-like GNAT family acetyltransferase